MENNLNTLDPSLFEFAQADLKLSDTKMKTKRIGYFKDAFLRFCRDKASITAAVIILLLFLFAIVAPFAGRTNYTETRNDTNMLYYTRLLPKSKLFSNLGFWNGTKSESNVSEITYMQYQAFAEETGMNAVKSVTAEKVVDDKNVYDITYDSYAGLGLTYITFTYDQYKDVQEYQDKYHIQIIYPAVDSTKNTETQKSNANIWFECKANGRPVLDNNGNYKAIYKTTGTDDYTSTMRIASDDGSYRYARPSGTADYDCRVSLYNYFQYLYGYEPTFLFGTDTSGYDIFTRLGSGARLSFALAFAVSIINLIIGAIWGSISGYYGGTVDLIMERITDILSGIPFMVVTTLFQLHLAAKVGALPSLLFAFVTTGWIGTAATVRMQFYRYKNQEYVLAARTLGAKDSRIMFKHVFPNALGTIITSSVLVIPSVIFDESSLTYLNIVNLEGDDITSVGTMLAHGHTELQNYPHIILFPALFISLLMITFNLFGNGLRDAFNPSLRGSED